MLIVIFLILENTKMSANALLWADFLADGEGPLEIIGQDATLSQFYCETCDKDLKSEELRKQHFAEHIPCAFPGCKFEVSFLLYFSPKILKKKI